MRIHSHFVNGKAPTAFWGELAPCEHIVQLYEDHDVFMENLEAFVREGLNAGEAVIVITTEAHRTALEERLVRDGLDLIAASADERYIAMSAEAAVKRFMVNGWPDKRLFHDLVDELLERAGAGKRKVRAFGEMVAYLWSEGMIGATVQLEQLWHTHCKEREFAVFCAYPKAGFTADADASIQEICSAHTLVLER